MQSAQPVTPALHRALTEHAVTSALLAGVDVPTGPEVLAELLQRPAWHQHAACRGVGPGPFHEHEHADDARALCEACPVVNVCLDTALARGLPQDEGVFGGATKRERTIMVRRRTGTPPPAPKQRKSKKPMYPPPPPVDRERVASIFADIHAAARR